MSIVEISILITEIKQKLKVTKALENYVMEKNIQSMLERISIDNTHIWCVYTRETGL